MSLLPRSLLAAAMMLAGVSVASSSELLEAEVLSVDGRTVTVELSEQPPDWLSEGSTVQAIGWDSTVATVEGNTVQLDFNGDRADDATVGGTIPIRAIATEQLTCG